MSRRLKSGRGRYPSAVKTMYDGIVFDSKRESLRYQDLEIMQNSGMIRDLDRQVRYKITIGGVPVRYDNGRHMTYVADFKYYDLDVGRWVTEDCKGHRTDVYIIKRALMLAMGVEILET